MMTALMQRIRGRVQQRQTAALSSYRDFVIAAATGEADADTIAEFLDREGFDVSQFEKDVAQHSKRLAWRAELDARAGLQKQLFVIAQKKLDAEANRIAVIEAAELAYLETVNPLIDEERATSAAIARASQAEVHLRQSANPDIAAKINALQQKQSRIRDEINGNSRRFQRSFTHDSDSLFNRRSRAERELREARSDQTMYGQPRNSARLAEAERVMSELMAAEKAFQKTVDDWKAEIRDLDSEIAKLEAESLLP